MPALISTTISRFRDQSWHDQHKGTKTLPAIAFRELQPSSEDLKIQMRYFIGHSNKDSLALNIFTINVTKPPRLARSRTT